MRLTLALVAVMAISFAGILQNHFVLETDMTWYASASATTTISTFLYLDAIQAMTRL